MEQSTSKENGLSQNDWQSEDSNYEEQKENIIEQQGNMMEIQDNSYYVEDEEGVVVAADNKNLMSNIIVEEFARDWEDEFENETSVYQLKRRQINLGSTHEGLSCSGYGFVCSIAIYKNQYLFMGTSQNQFFCYDLSTNTRIFDDNKHQDWVLSIQIVSLNGVDIVISGGGLYDRTLCFYDLSQIHLRNIKLINQIVAHKKSITKMHFIEDKNILITCGSDSFFKLWKLELIFPNKKGGQANEIMEEDQGAENENDQNNKMEEMQPQNNNKESEDEDEVSSDMLSEDGEASQLKIKLRLLHSISDSHQVYSVCESDDNFLVYGTGSGFIKILKFNPQTNKARQIRSFKLQRSIWCLQRFTNFKYIVGYSFQTQGRIDIINIVTGQHIMNFFKDYECIHSFKIITRLTDKNIVIKNKEDFIKKCKNQIALVGASKLGMVKVVNIGDRLKTPIEYSYSFNQNIEWIPWNALSVIPQENDEEYPEYQRYKVYCSTGNTEKSSYGRQADLIPVIYFDWSV